LTSGDREEIGKEKKTLFSFNRPRKRCHSSNEPRSSAQKICGGKRSNEGKKRPPILTRARSTPGRRRGGVVFPSSKFFVQRPVLKKVPSSVKRTPTELLYPLRKIFPTEEEERTTEERSTLFELFTCVWKEEGLLRSASGKS